MTGDIMTNYTYDVSSMINSSIIDNPTGWLSGLNVGVGGFLMLGLLASIGIILFLSMRNFVTSDSEALSYSGLVVSIAGILIFVINTGGAKLITWPQLLPFFLITAIAFYVDFTSRNY